MCLCAQPSLCAPICHSLYLGMEGHPCMCLICACVCVWEHSLTPTVDTGSVTVWTLGCVDDWESRPACPFCGERILIIQSDLNLGCLWGCYPLPRDELILLLHERPPTGEKAGEENCDAPLKGTPEVSAISSTGVKVLLWEDGQKNTKSFSLGIKKLSLIETKCVYTRLISYLNLSKSKQPWKRYNLFPWWLHLPAHCFALFSLIPLIF